MSDEDPRGQTPQDGPDPGAGMPSADAEGDAGEPSEARDETGGAEAAGDETTKRRRRGRRGGRRHRRKEHEGDEAAEPAAPSGEAGAAGPEPEQAAVQEPDGGARGQENAEAVTETPKRRRRRGGRSKKAAADAGGEEGTGRQGAEPTEEPRVEAPPESAVAGQAPAEARAEEPVAGGERPRRRRRGGRSRAAAPADKRGDDRGSEPAAGGVAEAPGAEAEPGPVAVPEPEPEAAPESAGLVEFAAPVGSFAEARADVKGAVGARRRRRKKAPVEPVDTEGAVETPAVAGDGGVEAGEVVPEAPASADAATGQATEEGEPKAGKRRGRRGGRGRRKTAAAPDDGAREPEPPLREATVADQAPASPEAVAGEESDTETTTTRKGRGRRRDRFARPEPTVPPEIPGYKEILVSTDAEELRVALVEDGRLAEIYFERPGKRSYAGNIYRGKAESVLAGMDASFIDIGLDRNGFLYVDDIADPEDGSKRPRKITQMLKAGQEIVVQVNKDPMGSKGARLTGKLSLAGRYLVYVPGGSGVGVSRRLGQDERDRLRDICKSLKVKNAGLIVRTVAEGKDVDEMKRDLQYLSRLWTRLKKKADTIKAPGLVYEEADVSLQVARDLFNDTFSQVIVDDAKQKAKLVDYLKKTAPELVDRVKLYDGDGPLFKTHGIDEQISRALERRVPLPSGGNLVIDHAEALTVIDVNTGRFTGGKGLEDTITRNNLEAAREVVRQLRLRDIGGIIIIDFIDMEHPKNRDAVLNKLQAELETDRTKTYVVEISPLGLVEMTRQNITDGARGILTQTCPVCEGRARIPSAETVALGIERRLLEHSGRSGAKALLIEVNAAVADRMAAFGRAKRIEKATRKSVFFEGSRQLPIDTFRIVAEGTVAAVEAHRIPVREEQELTVELEYGLTYSPGDAVAHIDGYQLVVLNGRRHLGEKKKVKVVTTTRAGGIAALAG